jgi:hypothetical protein
MANRVHRVLGGRILVGPTAALVLGFACHDGSSWYCSRYPVPEWLESATKDLAATCMPHPLATTWF